VSNITPPASPPGWFADPDAAGGLRWFDGTRWTDHRAAAGRPELIPPAQTPQDPAAKKRRRRNLVVGVTAAVVALTVMVATQSNDKQAVSYTVNQCIVANGSFIVHGTVTNHTKNNELAFTLDVLVSDGKFPIGASGDISINYLRPGDTQSFDWTGRLTDASHPLVGTPGCTVVAKDLQVLS
jgi:hypothetical protein